MMDRWKEEREGRKEVRMKGRKNGVNNDGLMEGRKGKKGRKEVGMKGRKE